MCIKSNYLSFESRVVCKEPETDSQKRTEENLLQKASSVCQEKLRILKKLRQLREARVTQFRNQGLYSIININSLGKFYPPELDEAFEAKLRHELEVEKLMTRVKALSVRLSSNRNCVYLG